MPSDTSRRQFLLQAMTGLSGVWICANWTALLSAADHAHAQTHSAAPAKLEFFSPAEAVEIEAVTARIIPTTDTPGARESGAVYFIDRSLVTFAKDQQHIFREGLPALQAHTKKMFPDIARFSAASPDQQDEILRSLEKPAESSANPFAPPNASSFFQVVRIATVAGFLTDPDTRGNPNGVGWKLIGHDRAHTFQPPFGYYDKDYPGWQPAPAAKDGAGQ